MDLLDKIKLFPHSPGVYRYYDSEGNVIYVGKAKDLHKRVAQYFVPADRLTRKTAVMVSKIADAEYTVVDSEADGKAAIAYLKRTGGGRATFLPISVVKGKELHENGLERCRGYVGIASELVTCDSKYQGIIDNRSEEHTSELQSRI